MFTGSIVDPKTRQRAWLDSLFVDHAMLRLGWDNFAEVIPGRIYRSNHPTPARLAAAKRKYNLRSVINLRGHRQCGSDALSRDASERLGLIHIDRAFESRGAPHKDRILDLAHIADTLVEPALIHCKSGADRAGLASGLFLLFNGGTAKQALAQLSWRFGHITGSRTGILDAFFLRFAQQGEGKSSFLDWVRYDYDETALRRDFIAGGISTFFNDRLLARE